MKTFIVFAAFFTVFASAFHWEKRHVANFQEDLAFMNGEEDLAMFNPIFVKEKLTRFELVDYIQQFCKKNCKSKFWYSNWLARQCVRLTC